MKVIIIHLATANTVAVIDDDAVLDGLNYSDVDPEDSKKLLEIYPLCKLHLHKIVNSIFCNFGARVQTGIVIDLPEHTAGALNG